MSEVSTCNWYSLRQQAQHPGLLSQNDSKQQAARGDAHLLPDMLPHGIIFIQPPLAQGVHDVHLRGTTAVSY